MLSPFRRQKAVCLVLRTAHDILNNALIPGIILGKADESGSITYPIGRLCLWSSTGE